MSKYYCPYCTDIISCMHELRYILDEPEEICVNINNKRNFEEDINTITFKFKKIKVDKKISINRYKIDKKLSINRYKIEEFELEDIILNPNKRIKH